MRTYMPTTVFAICLLILSMTVTARSQSFLNLNGPLPQNKVIDLVVGKGASQTIFAADRFQAMHSENQGGSWNRANPSIATPIAITCKADNPQMALMVNGTNIYKSTNGGSSWTTIVAGPATPYRVGIAPQSSSSTNNGVALIGSQWTSGSNQALWRSSNNGDTWDKSTGISTNTNINDIFFHPTLSYIWVCGSRTNILGNSSAPDVNSEGSAFRKGVWRSTNGGTTWLFKFTSNNIPPNERNVTAIAFNTSTGVLWAAEEVYTAPTISVKLFNSGDNGDNWNAPTTPFTNAKQVRALKISTIDPNLMYAGTDNGIWMSENNGSSWSDASAGLGPDGRCVHQIGFDQTDPAGSITVYIATCNSVYSRTRTSGAWSAWTLKSTGSSLSNVATVGASNGTALAATLDSTGGFKYAGGAWSRVFSLDLFKGHAAAVDSNNVNNAYIGGSLDLPGASSGQAYVTNDGGTTWSLTLSHGTNILCLAHDQASGSAIAFAGVGGATQYNYFRSTDNGSSWSPILLGGSPSVPVNSIAIDNSGGTLARVYAGCGNAIGLLSSTNGGVSFTSVAANYNVKCVAVNSTASQYVYFCDNLGNLYQSSNYGSSPVLRSGVTGVTSVVLDPTQSDGLHLFVSASSPGGYPVLTAIYKSSNGGSTWTVLPGTESVIPPPENSLSVDVAAKSIYASTTQGVYLGAIPAPAPIWPTNNYLNYSCCSSGSPLQWTAMNNAITLNMTVTHANGTIVDQNDNLLGTASSDPFVAPVCAANLTYAWCVTAGNFFGTGQSCRSFTTASPPSTPILSGPANTATNVNWCTGYVNLNWSLSNNTSNLDLWVSTNGGASWLSGYGPKHFSSVVYSENLPVVCNQPYAWKLTANNCVGSATSALYSFTTYACAPPPQVSLAVPGNGQGVTTPTTLVVGASTTGACSYHIQVANDVNFACIVAEVTQSSNLLSFSGTNTQYWWRAAGVNSFGEGPWSTTYSFTIYNFTSGQPPATAPTLLTPVNNDNAVCKTAPLSWTAVSGTVLYDVRLSSDGGANWILYSTSQTSMSPVLNAGTAYLWKVSAANYYGCNESAASAFTTVSALGAPTLTFPPDGANLVCAPVTLQWTAVPNATQYQITLRGTIYYSSTNSLVVNTLLASTAYGWTVASKYASCPDIFGVSTLFTFTTATNCGGGDAFASERPVEAHTKPLTFALAQNFPNPFNPTTRVEYALPTDVYVTLKVYDILGRQVMTVLDGFEEAGFKSAEFDASRLPSGMYFYRLTAGTFTDIKKMMLTK